MRILFLGLIFFIPIIGEAQVAEICANGLDDDGDSMIDCDDPDCAGPFFTDKFTNGGYGNQNSGGIHLGDLDGDGDLDAWIANSGNTSSDRLWINQGGAQGGNPGEYVDSGQALGNDNSTAVALGDLDNDGDLDAWVTKANHFPNLVWINQGGMQGGISGIFADSGQLLGDSYSLDVALSDLDEDGDLDAWVANGNNQPNRVWMNDGLGNFSDSGQTLGVLWSTAVKLGDLDSDGDIDAWVTNSGFRPNKVWINQGGAQVGQIGTFISNGQGLGFYPSQDVALGDLDGDGDLDAWVANLCCAPGLQIPNQIWLNDSLGNFFNSGQELGFVFSSGVDLGDLDGDGDLDAWVANPHGNPNRVWINQGGLQGSLQGLYAESMELFGGSNSWDVDLGDLDGDGDLDALIANNGPNSLRFNQGNAQGGIQGTFLGINQSLGNMMSTGVDIGDLDGDGDLDAFVSNAGHASNKVWINQGGDQGGIAGSYLSNGQILGGSTSWDVDLGDLDDDGDLDAWVANSGGTSNKVWLNQSGIQNGVAATFEHSGQNLGNQDSTSVCLGDVDDDGDLDAWVANRGSNRVWINQGGDQGGPAGTFEISGQALGDFESYDIKLGDLDGDGDLDAWVANSGPNHIWINQGGAQSNTPGVFAISDQALGNSTSEGVALGDVDSDGDLDAWVANSGANQIWINQGGVQRGTEGTFQNSGQLFDASTSADVDLADLDNDGDLDAWVANRTGQPNHVWINQGGIQMGPVGTFVKSSQSLGAFSSFALKLGDFDGDGAIDAWVATGLDFSSSSNRVWFQYEHCDNDLDADGVPNFCDPDHSPGSDCDANGVIDHCDIAGGSPDYNSNGIPDQCEGPLFIRGDINSDHRSNIVDVILSLRFLFTQGTITCEKSVDSNDDGITDLSDAIHLLDYLFSSGAPPLAPFPDCDTDSTADSLGCDSFNLCQP